MPVRQLSETTVNRIAAGEVVERPASVVKELIENALDAGATRIEIATDGGGRRLIRVADDGAGMPRADLDLAVERHATSKLDGDDLLQISTLGFRGEALPSIGSVARLTITTRHAGEPNAWAITVDGGAKAAIKPAALSEGTRVEVKDLFYATPARLKFLKSDRSEAEAVREVGLRDNAFVRALLMHALKEGLAREGQRAATTGGSATIAAFRPATLPRRGAFDWRRSPSRPLPPRGAVAAWSLLDPGFAETAQAVFDVGGAAATARGEVAEPAPDLLDR